ncbi:hypothetical protein MHI37_27640 [Paenibacillus sp. FSL H8-0548]|nr:hypothetical protein [Paenibacillus sp. FSL H8-0548]
MNESGSVVSEGQFAERPGFGQDDYNRFGMAFRIKAPPGACQMS